MASDLNLDPDINFLSQFNKCNSSYLQEGDLANFFNLSDLSCLNIIHINCRSLPKNFKSLNTLLQVIGGQLSVIAVSETWLSGINEDLFLIDGYKFVSKSRSSKLGGGVGLYLNTELAFKLHDDLSVSTDIFECIFVEVVQLKAQNIIIGCVYRPPNTDVSRFNVDFSLLLNKLDLLGNKLTFILGDFNLDLLKSDVHIFTGEFLNNFTAHSFLPTINLPTRITETSSTLIDNIFVNNIKNRFDTAIIYNDISDHFPVAIHFEMVLQKSKPVTEFTKRLFSPQSLYNFKLAVADINWNEISMLASISTMPSDCYSSFISKFLEVFNQFFPNRTFKFSKKKYPRHEWMTKGLIKSCNKKSRLYKKFRQDPSLLNKTKYVIFRNKLKSLLVKAEKFYYREKFNSIQGDLCKTWKLLRTVMNRNNTYNVVNDFVAEDGSIITNTKEVVEHFNNYFVNIGNKLASVIPPSCSSHSLRSNRGYLNSFVFYPTDAQEVVHIVNNLNDKNSAGIDNIPSTIMRSTIQYTADVLSSLINCSFRSGNFPDQLKIAKVCPIFKGGSLNIFSNYRPISVLPCFSKIFEKVAYIRIEKYLSSNKIIIDNQYGFRANHSSYMAILEMYNRISKSIDDHKVSAGVFIDLSKAFDTINHERLFDKLEHYGFRGLSLQWLKDYLSNRKQYVFFNNHSSSIQNITCGVPQGSILGPLLFLLYVNDIVHCSKSLQFILFADDTNLFLSADTFADLMVILNDELNKLSDWFCANKLSVNIAKTKYILFGGKQKLCSEPSIFIAIDGVALERVEFTKFLGVYIDENLNWKQHTSHISLKVAKSLGVINRIRSIVSSNVLKSLYYTLIHPYLLYCNIIWGGASQLALYRLTCLQKRAMRLITHSPFRAPSTPLFTRLRVLKLPDIHRYQIGLYMYKAKNNLLPFSCAHHTRMANITHRFVLRDVNFFEIIPFRTELRRKYIGVAGPEIWHVLPENVKTLATLSIFKKRLFNLILEDYAVLV